MDQYTIRNLESHILPNQQIMEDMARDGTSLSYYLALTHIGGPGALFGGKLKTDDWLGTSTHAYATGVSNVYERTTSTAGAMEAIARIDPLPGARITSDDLILFAEEHIGKPYVYGSDGKTSMDCSQLVVESLKKARVVHSGFDTTAEMLSLNSSTKNPANTERGDLVFIRKNGRIAHVMIALSSTRNGTIRVIDASPRAGVSERTIEITSDIEVGKLSCMV